LKRRIFAIGLVLFLIAILLGCGSATQDRATGLEKLADAGSLADPTVTIELKDSNGNPLSGGKAYYKGGPVSPGTWFNFGTTGSDGKCSKGLTSSYTYSFKVEYNKTTGQKDGVYVGTDPITVSFQTSSITVELKTCAGTGLSGGTVKYRGSVSSGTWFTFGTTGADGKVSKEMFPGNWWFQVFYNNTGSEAKQQDVGANPLVTFTTTKVTLYYSGSIKYRGNPSSGTFFTFTKPSMEMLPGTIKFKFGNYETAVVVSGCSMNKVVNTLILKDHNGNPLSGGTARGGFGSNYGTWHVSGSTDANGVLLDIRDVGSQPGNMSYEIRYNSTTQVKTQDVSVNSVFQFQTILLTLRLQTCGGTPLDGGNPRYGPGSTYTTWWFPGGVTGSSAPGETAAEFFPGTYSFEMLYKSTAEAKVSVVIPNANTMLTWQTTKVTLQYSGAISYGGATGDSTWFNKPSMELLPGTYKFHFRDAGRMDLTFSGCEFTRSVFALKLINSGGSGIAGGTGQYYDSGWQNIPGSTGADGILLHAIPGLKNTLSFRMTYASASQQKSQNIATNSIVVFQTKLVTFKLLDSTNAEITGAGTQYYAGGWKTFGGGTTTTIMELLPVSYSFRVSYAGASQQKSQNVGADPDVVFQTVPVTMKLLDSNGTTELNAGAEYYAGGWKTFGGGTTTTTMELLPVSYSFRVSYAGASQQKSQNVGTTPLVQFQTTLVTMKLLDSAGTTQLNAGAEYYAGGWKTFGSGTTTTTMELLPVSYSFRVSYAGASQQKSQNVGTNAVVVFQTGQVHSDSGNCTQYYASGWKAFTQDMELLPVNYAFRFSDGFPQTSYTIVAGTTTNIH